MESEEYEYEYHETETESFYLNLDLTSLNGLLRPPRHQTNTPLPPDSEPALDHPQHALDEDDPAPLDGPQASTLSDERIQLLGLHTCNPIVSYYNRIFSCSWADQIGTELVFAHPDQDAAAADRATLCPPLRQDPAFHLIAANSVKLLARKANITSSSAPPLAKSIQPPANSNPADIPPSTSHDDVLPTVPRRPEPPSQQAAFIQRLQALKQAKGETDTVRTVMSSKRPNPSFTDRMERLNAWARTESQVGYVQNLNLRASNGDQEAEDILLQMLWDLDDGNTSQRLE